MEEIQQFDSSKSFCGTALDGHPLISAIFSKWQQDGFAVVFMELLKVRGNVKSIAPGITSNGLQSPTAAIFVQSPNSCPKHCFQLKQCFGSLLQLKVQHWANIQALFSTK